MFLMSHTKIYYQQFIKAFVDSNSKEPMSHSLESGGLEMSPWKTTLENPVENDLTKVP